MCIGLHQLAVGFILVAHVLCGIVAPAFLAFTWLFDSLWEEVVHGLPTNAFILLTLQLAFPTSI